jgi:hypothetical protein
LSNVSIAVIHYPAYDKNGNIVATSLNNVELHDLARTCMTFETDLCYIVSPLPKQRQLMDQLLDHWLKGYGATYNPDRSLALRKIVMRSTLEEVLSDMDPHNRPLVIGTSSRERGTRTISYEELRKRVRTAGERFLLLFGTGWGLTENVIEQCHMMLPPLKGAGDFNHLSLRVAMGIILDRIFGERGGAYERDG